MDWKNPADGNGHSTKLVFRVPPETARKVQRIAYAEGGPYQSTVQLLRHALDRHLSWLEEQDQL